MGGTLSDRRLKNHLNQWRTLARANISFAENQGCRNLTRAQTSSLELLTREFELSIAAGELLLIDGGWYVTHTGLIRLSCRKRCCGIKVQPVNAFCDRSTGRYCFRATVYKSPKCKGFIGYGDADPSNVSPLVHGAELRIAETRAVNRALRKAYGIGICSVEELASSAIGSRGSAPESKKLPPPPTNGNYGGPKVRDRLCQIIRKHVRHGLLRRQDPARSDQGAGREFRHPLGRLGRERPQFPALPAQ